MNKKNEKKKLSQTNMILLSLYRAANGTKDKVPEEEIIIQAWKDFAHSFSLRNHPEYPDGSAVSKRMADQLKPRGLVIGLGNNVFRLTDKGIKKAKNLLLVLENESSIEKTAYRHLSRAEESFINHALKTQAFSTWKNNKKEDLIDYDAKLFFRFSTGTKIEERTYKVHFAKEAIQKSIDIGIKQANELKELACFLVDNFKELFEEKRYG